MSRSALTTCSPGSSRASSNRACPRPRPTLVAVLRSSRGDRSARVARGSVTGCWFDERRHVHPRARERSSHGFVFDGPNDEHTAATRLSVRLRGARRNRCEQDWNAAGRSRERAWRLESCLRRTSGVPALPSVPCGGGRCRRLPRTRERRVASLRAKVGSRTRRHRLEALEVDPRRDAFTGEVPARCAVVRPDALERGRRVPRQGVLAASGAARAQGWGLARAAAARRVGRARLVRHRDRPSSVTPLGAHAGCTVAGRDAATRRVAPREDGGALVRPVRGRLV